MIFDTDILIWVQRGNTKAANLIEKAQERKISIQTYMELLQNPQSRMQIEFTKNFLDVFYFEVLPLTENIGHRAAIYIEEYSLKTGIRAGDAIIAATATENHLQLVSGNKKHYKNITDLKLKIFSP